MVSSQAIHHCDRKICKLKFCIWPQKWIHLVSVALQLICLEQILLNNKFSCEQQSIMKYDILGHRNNTNKGNRITVSYSKLLDQLYDGLIVRISCTTSDPDHNISLVWFSTDGNEKSRDNGCGTVSHVFLLSPNMIGTSFACENQQTFTKEKFVIKDLLCNPFGWLPEMMHCEHNKVCLIRADNAVYCSNLTQNNCFLAKNIKTMIEEFPTSLSPYGFVCNGVNPLEDIHGICHAQSENISNLSEMAISSNGNSCDTVCLKLNNKDVYMNGLLIEDTDPKYWSIQYQYKTTAKRHSDTVICHLECFSKTIAVFQGNDRDIDLPLVFNEVATINYTSPQKLFLSCQFGKNKEILFHSFVLLYDRLSSVFKPSLIYQYSEDRKSVDLICRCSVPIGFFCALSWSRITANLKLKDFIENKITNETFLSNTITKGVQGKRTCFSSAYVFIYQSVNKFIRLTDPSLNDSITILDDSSSSTETIRLLTYSKSGTGLSATLETIGSPTTPQTDSLIVNSKSGTNSPPTAETIVLGVALPLLFLTLIIIAVTVFCGLKKNKELLKLAESAQDPLLTFKSPSTIGRTTGKSSVQKSAVKIDKKKINVLNNFKNVFANEKKANSISQKNL